MWVTETIEGPIPSKEYRSPDGHVYNFVVKQNIYSDVLTSKALHGSPQRDGKGRLIYAVPGGGAYIEGVGLV